MRLKSVIFFSISTLLLTPQASAAGEEFFGLIESRPTQGDTGTWVIGGRSVEVTNKTSLDEDNGPFVIGACVEVELDRNGGFAIEISTEGKLECRR